MVISSKIQYYIMSDKIALMFDASSKYYTAIHFGNFDECYNLQVERKDTSTGKITGKYCLIDFLYEKKHTLMTSNEVMFDFDPNESVWEMIKIETIS